MSQSSLPRIFYRRGVPLWRDVVVLQWIAQVLSAVVVLGFMAFFVRNVLRGAEARGLSWGYGFLSEAAGFPISESLLPYDASYPFSRAFVVGILNTLKVSLVGVVLATLIGIVAAVARLSTNWLISKIASVYIEIIRNVPLLVQLFFWYFGFFQRLPAVKDSLSLPGPIYLSQRGLYMVWFKPTSTFWTWMIFVGAGLVLACVLYLVLNNYQLRTGRTTYPVATGLAVLIGLPLIGWFLVGASPLYLTVPVMGKFNFDGGLRLTTEYGAMLTGLVIYTGAFIAEVVRAGILAVDRGQFEAARAIGLTPMLVLRLVVFPQAMRVIIPPLISQYLNLAKNSSLAILIGYADVFFVGRTIINQSGRAVPVFLLIMAIYLTISVITSFIMNIYNRRVKVGGAIAMGIETTSVEAAGGPVSGRPAPPGPVQWLKKNLFSTWYNTILTIVGSVLIFFIVKGIVNWVLFVADWSPVTESLKLFAVGLYPTEEIWRIGAILAMVSFLMGLSWGVWGGTVRTFAVALGIGFTVIALLPFDLYPPNDDPLDLMLRLGFLVLPVLVVLGHLLGRTSPVSGRLVMILWLVSFVLTLVFLSGFEGSTLLPKVGTTVWGGLLLTFLLAIVGIVASFPIGVLLALGRQSSLPVVKVFCVMFIEIVRGVPLVTILFMASIILPLFLPEEIRIDRVLRAMIGMTLFAAAYMAENVRGGLQAIPAGQYEAAKAVGLTRIQTTVFIILPQALRAVIPTIVGQFISLFMDTTLAIIVGLMELLAVGKAVLQTNQEWLLRDKEVYLFIAVVFWIFTYSMSYASRRLEVTLGLGER